MKIKLAVVATHPIQYFSPWFCEIARSPDVSLRVFYLWDYGVNKRMDPGFQQSIQWDIPLLSGYDYEFVSNVSRGPGTHRFFGLRNPSLPARVRDYDPDAVLLLGYNFASLWDLIFRWRRGDAPLILRGDSHRLFKTKGFQARLRRHAISHIFRRFSAFLYVGTANYDYYRYHGVPCRKLFRSPHAIDNERFSSQTRDAERAAAEWKRDLGIPEDNAVVLYAGKWATEKRPLDLIAAFRLARLRNTSLLFVGAGKLERELRDAAAGCPDIFFAPFQNQTLMPRTYCAGDVFVLPSWSETWGLAVNEAMCMGRAVIVSDRVGCAPDLVRPRYNGLVFPAGDIAALARCLREAVEDRERLRRWGENSRTLIARHDYSHATAGLYDALRCLTSGAPRWPAKEAGAEKQPETHGQETRLGEGVKSAERTPQSDSPEYGAPRARGDPPARNVVRAWRFLVTFTLLAL